MSYQLLKDIELDQLSRSFKKEKSKVFNKKNRRHIDYLDKRVDLLTRLNISVSKIDNDAVFKFLNVINSNGNDIEIYQCKLMGRKLKLLNFYELSKVI